jgi:phosphatidylserine/phosphatidylglycerophosphate/cardiolipin synthase-like enzyme
MAKFLNTRKAVAEIETLIREADSRLILVSPYLRLSKDFKELLMYRNNQDKITTVIFGKQDLKPEEMKFLEGLRFVILKFHEDLHAKCYLNDTKMIITSLNLYEFSMANNKEMGVLIDLQDDNDRALFEEAYDEIQFIDSTSDRFEFQFNQQKKEEPKKTPKEPAQKIKDQKDFSKSKYKSTSALSKKIGISSKELFELFELENWIKRDGKSWVLTPKGEANGGTMKNSQYGEFVAWPEEIVEVLNLQKL